MNMKKNYFVFVGLFALLIGTVFFAVSCKKDSGKSSDGGEILYYTDAMHPEIKVEPKDYDEGTTQCPICNMDLMPVYAEEEKGESSGMAGDMKKAGGKRILYYTDAMHPEIKVESKDYDEGMTQCPICNMDLMPVYEKGAGEKKAGRKTNKAKRTAVNISEREAELAGIKTFEADYYHLSKEIVAVGKVAYDPELVVAEKEYITAIRSAEAMGKSHIGESKSRANNLMDEAAYKLKLMGLNDAMIRELKETKRVHSNLILPEKTVWVYADIYEFELGLVAEGQEMTVEATAYPGKYFKGKVKAIDSVLNPKTRSVRIRAEVSNTGMKLKPDMYVKVIISKNIGRKLAVPRDAVLDTGKRKLIYVDMGGGDYIQHEVETGYEAVSIVNKMKMKMINVKSGLDKGDMVVVRANFLIDSQSQLSGPAASQYGGAIESED